MTDVSFVACSRAKAIVRRWLDQVAKVQADVLLIALRLNIDDFFSFENLSLV